MRRLVRAILLTAAIGLLAAFPPVSAQVPPAHKDITTAIVAPDSLALFTAYGMAISFITSQRFQEASDIIRSLQYMNLPPDVRLLFERLLELTAELNSEMDTAQKLLTHAVSDLANGDRPSALERLDRAEVSLARVEQLASTIRASTNALGNRFNVFDLGTDDPLAKAFQRLQELLSQLERIRKSLQELQLTLEKETDPEAALEMLTETLNNTVPTPDQVVMTLTYQVVMTLTFPERWYPGHPLPISGTVRVVEGPERETYPVAVFLDGVMLTSFTAARDFNIDLSLPDNTTTGLHVVTLKFEGGGVLQGASVNRTLNAVRATPSVAIQVPWLILLPQQVEVKGTVTSELGPAANAQVILYMGNQEAVARTTSGGAFQTNVPLSLIDLLPGTRPLRVMITPQEPWHSTVQQESQIILFTSLNALLIVGVAAFVTGGLAVSRRRAAATRAIASPGAAPTTGLREGGASERTRGAEGRAVQESGMPGMSASVGWFPVLAITAGRIIDAYRQAARFLAHRREVTPRPDATLRDFLRAIGAPTGGPFDRLTKLAERALYGAPPLGEDAIQQADDLLSQTIRGER